MKAGRKGIIGVAVAAAAVVICTFFMWRAMADETVYENPDEWYTVSVQYDKHSDSGNPSETTKFEYRDSMILDNIGAKEYSADLALAGVDLAAAAYKESYIESALTSMGYTFTPHYDTTSTYEDNDHVAWGVGTKKVKYNDETYTIYIVPIRGTASNCEWYSNFNLGTGSKHEGFYKAAGEVEKELKSTIGTSDPEHTVIWIMGHSRGAAVANILAGELMRDKSYAASGNVIGYTYACPAVNKNADETIKNIYNFNSPGDPVPLMPLSAPSEDWGFKRYGETVSLDVEDLSNVNNRYQQVVGCEYQGLSDSENYQKAFLGVASSQDEFNTGDKQCLFKLIAWLMGGKSDSSVGPKDIIWECAPGMIVKKLINTGTTVTNAYGIRLLFKDQLSQEQEALEQLETALEAAEKEQQENPDFEFSVWRAENITMLKTAEEITETEITSISSIKTASRTISQKISDLTSFAEGINAGLDLVFDTDGAVLKAVTHGHAPQTYVLWVNSMFYGYNGWKDNQEITAADTSRFGSYVGEGCFQGSTITSLTTGDKVEKVGASACYDCDSLQELVLTNGVKTAGNRAFASCDALTKVTMPVDLEYTSNLYHTGGNPSGYYSTFYNTEAIQEIVYTKGMTGKMRDKDTDSSAKGMAYWACSAEGYSGSKLQKVSFADGITYIGNYAFNQCTALQEIEVPDSIISVGAYGFAGCTALNLDFSQTKIIEVGDYGFANSGLTALKVTGIEKVGVYAFSGSKISSIVFGSQLSEIPEGVVFNCNSLQEVTISDGITKAGNRAFASCGALTKITMPVDLEYTSNLYHTGGNPSGYYSTFYNTEAIQEIVYTKGTTGKMRDKDTDSSATGMVYWACSAEGYSKGTLQKVSFADGITYIGDYALYSCSALSEVKLPSNMIDVGKYSFSGSGLSGAITTVRNMGVYSFAGTKISSIMFQEELGEIPECVVSACSNLQEVTISDGISKAGNRAFASCGALTKITMPVDLEYTSNLYHTGGNPSGYYSTFYNTEAIQEIVYTKGTTGKMRDKDTDSSATGMVYWACSAEGYSRSKLQKVSFADGITYIGNYACNQCSALTQVSIPASVTTIGDHAFDGTSAAFRIFGAKDSFAESYASDNSKTFVALNYPVITPAEAALKKGETLQFAAQVYTDMDTVVDTVEWSVEGAGSEATTISDTGLLTVAVDEPKDALTVKATYGEAASEAAVTLEASPEVSLADCTVTLESTEYTADGTEKQPAVTVQYGDTLLEQGVHYQVTYSDNVDPGTATVTVTAIEGSGYTGSAAATFEIREAAVPDKDLSECTLALENDTYVYDGTEKQPAVTVTDGETVLEEKTHYTVTYENNVEVGTATVTVTAAEGSGYAGSAQTTFTIEEAPKTDVELSTCTIMLDEEEFTYDGTEKKPAVTIKDGEAALTEDVHYTVAYADNVEVGTGRVTVTAVEGSGYIGSAELTFTIAKAPKEVSLETCTVTLSQTEFTYDGTEKKPAVTVTDGETALTEGTHYTVAYTDNVEVGTGRVTVTAVEGSGYTGSAELTFTIVAAPKADVDLADCQVTLSQSKYAYDGTEKKPEVTVTDGETALKEGTHYTAAYTNNTNVGKAAVTITAVEGSGYTGSVTAEFTIEEMAFKDVQSGSWYNSAVTYAFEHNVMSGLSTTEFGVDEPLTRAQFATILWRASGSPDVTYTAKFTDVPAGQWYTDGVLWANSIGVVSGYGNGVFGTEDSITREQMAVMMYRYATYKKYDLGDSASLDSFSDADQISSYAVKALKWAVGNGIMSGKSGGKLDPQGKATRAECAAIIMRFMEKYQ